MAEEPLSASKRMEYFRREMKIEQTGLANYWKTLPFSPDRFQIDALEAVALGESVLVCAPTGAGKTVVGEGAADLALNGGVRAFYTTPIKALSNQKLRDFQEKFGEQNVGLLTGDTTLRPNAPIVVMTTEVLRNMIYVETNLDSLGVVVLDEVHYLSDKFRGPVWEEIIIQLPQKVQIVALSATISNSTEFGNWISSIRGSCKVIKSTKRPVPLYQNMMVGSKLYDLYAHPRRAAKSRHNQTRQLNPDLLQVLSCPLNRDARNTKRRGGMRVRRVSRSQIVEKLYNRNLLPTIFFIFSRAGCDDAASEVAGAGLGLTTHEEQQRIRDRADVALDMIPAEDHGALGLASWVQNLVSGVAAHHAGLLPVLKETVEELFSEGLLKVVFATETLALGINMPARTVVLESLDKWDGSRHVRLGAREYTQLTGRAGRRGIDVEGHAVVIERRQISPEEVASLASRRSYPLRSAFYPTYNMAVNLLARSNVEVARQVLESSFAQYQADSAVVELAQKLRKLDAKVTNTKVELHCDAGDAAKYFEMRESVARLQKQSASMTKKDRHESGWEAHLPRNRKAAALLKKAADLENQLKRHPVHSCPRREMHANVGHSYVRSLRERDRVAEQVAGRTARIVTEFDLVCQVLRKLRFLDGNVVTDRGQTLRRIYGERDLVIAESVASGIWAELDPAEFAAIVSTVVYEPRGDAAVELDSDFLPTPRLREAWNETRKMFVLVQKTENGVGVDRTPELSSKLVNITYRWAKGMSLAKILDKTDMSGGDFVRWMRQVIDMLEQIRRVKGSPLVDNASIARTLLLRNVVSWTENS